MRLSILAVLLLAIAACAGNTGVVTSPPEPTILELHNISGERVLVLFLRELDEVGSPWAVADLQPNERVRLAIPPLFLHRRGARVVVGVAVRPERSRNLHLIHGGTDVRPGGFMEAKLERLIRRTGVSGT